MCNSLGLVCTICKVVRLNYLFVTSSSYQYDKISSFFIIFIPKRRSSMKHDRLSRYAIVCAGWLTTAKVITFASLIIWRVAGSCDSGPDPAPKATYCCCCRRRRQLRTSCCCCHCSYFAPGIGQGRVLACWATLEEQKN